MTQQSGRYGYKPNEPNGMSEQAIDKTRELAEEALDRADEWLKPTGLSIKERPMTVLAVVGGLAFAAGAIWMLRNSRQQSRYQEMLDTLSNLPRRAGWRQYIDAPRLVDDLSVFDKVICQTQREKHRSLADVPFRFRVAAFKMPHSPVRELWSKPTTWKRSLVPGASASKVANAPAVHAWLHGSECAAVRLGQAKGAFAATLREALELDIGDR